MSYSPQGKGLDSTGFTVSRARLLELGYVAWLYEAVENVGSPEMRKA